MKKALFGIMIVGVIIIVGAAMVLSFNALNDFAHVQGRIDLNLSFLWPVIVDVSLVIFTVGILVFELSKWDTKPMYGLVVFFAIVTIIANLLHAPSNWMGYFVGVLPPLAIVLASEGLRITIRNAVDINEVESIKPTPIKPTPIKPTPIEENLLVDVDKGPVVDNGVDVDVDEKAARKKAIVHMLKQMPTTSVKSLMNETNANSPQVIYGDLNELEAAGIIKQVRSGNRVKERVVLNGHAL